MFRKFAKISAFSSLALPFYLADHRRRPVHCCGIIGVLTVNKNAE